VSIGKRRVEGGGHDKHLGKKKIVNEMGEKKGPRKKENQMDNGDRELKLVRNGSSC